MAGREIRHKIDVNLSTAYILDAWIGSIKKNKGSGERRLIIPLGSSETYGIASVVAHIIKKVEKKNRILSFSECYREELAPFVTALSTRQKAERNKWKRENKLRALKDAAIYFAVVFAIVLIAFLIKTLF